MNFRKTFLCFGLAAILLLGLTTTVSAANPWNKPQHHQAYYQPHHQPQIIHNNSGQHHHYNPHYPQHHGYHSNNCHCYYCCNYGYSNNNRPIIKIGKVGISLGNGYKNW
ncbi:MAG: hypothetical protein LBC20_00915 [Planctomycetaceae bacterium]|jgi:hypothetical protein|nr:hypothetical protein [Planctomycetaceae bacterium]